MFVPSFCDTFFVLFCFVFITETLGLKSEKNAKISTVIQGDDVRQIYSGLRITIGL